MTTDDASSSPINAEAGTRRLQDGEGEGKGWIGWMMGDLKWPLTNSPRLIQQLAGAGVGAGAGRLANPELASNVVPQLVRGTRWRFALWWPNFHRVSVTLRVPWSGDRSDYLPSLPPSLL